MKKMLFKLLMVLPVLIFTQNGKVVNEKGESQVFCKVSAPELGLTTYTDSNGNYSIDAPEGTKLVFEYINYEVLEVVSKDSMVVTLKDSEIIFPSTL